MTAGATTSGVDTTLSPGGHITGTVTDSHHVGIAGFEIFVFDAAMNISIAWTDSAGNYDVGGLATGTYRVEFNDYTNDTLTQYYNDEPSLGQADPVAVTAGETTPNIDCTLAGEATVSGTITDATNGNPISYAHVEFQPVNLPVGTGVCDATTDSNGSYSCSMPAGQYLVEFEASSYQPLWYDGSTTEIGATTFTVAANQVVERSRCATHAAADHRGRDHRRHGRHGGAGHHRAGGARRRRHGPDPGHERQQRQAYDFVLSGLFPAAPDWQPVSLRVRFTDPSGVYATQLSDPFSVAPGERLKPGLLARGHSGRRGQRPHARLGGHAPAGRQRGRRDFGRHAVASGTSDAAVTTTSLVSP